MDKKEIIQIENQHYMPVFSRLPIVLDHGEGCYVYDNEGNKYLDFLAGIAVNSLGHGNKELVKALSDQAGKLIHCSGLFYTQVQSLLVQKLVKITGFDRVFLANSGAEANEGAIKLARKYAYKNYENKYKIISTNRSFHGRTLTTLAATGTPKYHEGYAPLPPGFVHVDYGDIKELEKVMADDVCAVLLEPVQGEGGVNVPPEGYLARVRTLCDKYGALLIFDEIQTGIGRTGKWFAYEQAQVKPDIMTIAKGIGGGYPIGAFVATEKVAQAFGLGDHGSTFGGNALGCAAANAVLDVIEKENLLDNVAKMGTYFMEKLKVLGQKYPNLIADVRGQGLLIGVELKKPGKEIVDVCLAKGFILNCTSVNVLRIVPPLIVSAEEIDLAVKILDEALAAQ